MNKIQEGVLHNDILDKNPFELFDEWYKEAEASEINDPDAMAVASVDNNGMPSVRIVLLKQWSQAGFIFFTNYTGRKGQELIATKKAAACLHWKSLRRQVRIVGEVDKLTPLAFPPMSSDNSSLTIFTRSCPGLRFVKTFCPIAFCLTFWVNSFAVL